MDQCPMTWCHLVPTRHHAVPTGGWAPIPFPLLLTAPPAFGQGDCRAEPGAPDEDTPPCPSDPRSLVARGSPPLHPWSGGASRRPYGTCVGDHYRNKDALTPPPFRVESCARFA